MVSSTWLLVIAATVIPSVNCKSGKDLWAQEGEEWRFLDGFLDWAKEKEYKNNTAGALNARAQGTFWNALRAKNHPRIEDYNTKCGISFYYPTMQARHSDKNNTALNPNTTWGVPFAAGPWCHDKDPIPTPDEYPGDQSVVFHQLYGGQAAWKDDCYMMLGGTLGDVNKQYWGFSDFNDTWAHCPGATTNDELGEQIKMYKDWGWQSPDDKNAELRTMLRGFIDTRHGGKIPNPHWDGHGKGSTIWQEYTGVNNFWGYNDKAGWYTEPQV